MAPERFLLHSLRRERLKKWKHIQHLAVAVALIVDGVSSLSGPHADHGVVIPVLIIAAGALLIGTVAYEKLRHAHHAASWVEIAGAVLAFAEALHRTQGKHHALFLALNFIVPLLVARSAWAEIRGHAEPFVQVDDTGVEMRLRRFFPRRVAWKNAKAIRIDGATLTFTLENGKAVVMNLAQVKNRAEALAWLTERLEQRGLAAQ
jgi:hypothetical protein